MREIESYSTDKDAVRFKQHQSAICVRPSLTATMLQLHSLLILTLVGIVFAVGKYRLCQAFNVRSLTVYICVQYIFQSGIIYPSKFGFKGKRPEPSPRSFLKTNRIHRFDWDICFSKITKSQLVFFVYYKKYEQKWSYSKSDVTDRATSFDCPLPTTVNSALYL
jgi:hypothetical protein